MSLLSLPSEVLEAVLINCALSDFPTAIAAVSQTCRTLRTLVYASGDQHLWREIFLTTFDDPRKLRMSPQECDWQAAFTERIWAGNLYRQALKESKNVYSACKLDSDLALSDDINLTERMLIALGTVFKTSAPCRSRPATPTTDKDGRGVTIGSLLHSQTLSYVDFTTPEFPVRADSPEPPEPSLNASWLKGLLEHGLPPFFAEKLAGEKRNKDWDGSAVGRALSQLVCCTGFIPTSTSGSDNAPEASTPSAPGSEPDAELAQVKQARFRARELVYRLQYLKRNKRWGPYVAFGRLPPPEHLQPDWVYLAAARITIESLLREIKYRRLHEFVTWDMWRESWVDPEVGRRKAQEVRETRDQQGGEGQAATDDATQWDWAGAEGVWRRCVLWLGYSHLLHYNMHGNFADPDLIENMLIVPIRMRIIGYEPPAVPEFPDRPTILLEGDTGGPEWEGYAVGVWDDVRRFHGSVSMLADGSVRWCLYTCASEDPHTDEFVSEGIQIGGIGSDAGFVGMWTGARHDHMDPLGPFWQWRVA